MSTGIKGNKSKSMETSKFLDVQLLADYIHISTSKIYKMVSNQTIPFVKIGTRTLFDRVQIDQWVINGGKMGDELPSLPIV
jgi:excisionase family DNA binding protein